MKFTLKWETNAVSVQPKDGEQIKHVISTIKEKLTYPGMTTGNIEVSIQSKKWKLARTLSSISGVVSMTATTNQEKTD